MKLTARRLDAIRDVLEKYSRQLQADRDFNCDLLETELRDRLEAGYKDIKGLMEDLLSVPFAKYVAVFYMENSNPMGVSVEFQAPLAQVYGISHYGDNRRDEARENLWQTYFSPPQSGD